MMSFVQDNNSQDDPSSSSDFSSHPEFEDTTKATSEGSSVFASRYVSNLVKNLKAIIPQVENPVITDQLDKLLVSIYMMIKIVQHRRPDLDDIPPLTTQVEEDGAVLLQWKFTDFRIGFNIESDPSESGWHLVSNEKLGEITASGRLSNINETVQYLLNFIQKNI